MRRDLNQLVKLHQKLLRQNEILLRQNKILDETIFRSGAIIENYLRKFCKGKSVKIEVFQPGTTFCVVQGIEALPKKTKNFYRPGRKYRPRCH